MTDINFNQPLMTVASSANHFPKRPKRNATTYDARLSAVAAAWGVPVADLYHPGLVAALDAKAEHDAFLAENEPLSPSTAKMTPAKKAQNAREVAQENLLRAEVRKNAAAATAEVSKAVQAAKDYQATFDHVLSVLDVDGTVQTVTTLGPWLAGALGKGVSNAADQAAKDAQAALVAEYRPQYVTALFRLLSLDNLLRTPSDGYALFVAPGFVGPLTFRVNRSVTGKEIGRVADYDQADVDQRDLAQAWQAAYTGDDRPRHLLENLPHGDRAVTALVQGLAGGLVLDIPRTWSELCERLESYRVAKFVCEDVDGAFSADVFVDTEFWRVNRVTNQDEPWISRKNLRTGEGTQFPAGAAAESKAVFR